MSNICNNTNNENNDDDVCWLYIIIIIINIITITFIAKVEIMIIVLNMITTVNSIMKNVFIFYNYHPYYNYKNDVLLSTLSLLPSLCCVIAWFSVSFHNVSSNKTIWLITIIIDDFSRRRSLAWIRNSFFFMGLI